MSAKEAPSLSAARKNQKTPLLVPKEIAPQIKTSVGITYAVLSEAILSTVKSAKPGRLDAGRLDQETILKFKDALFLSPRLSQWELEEYPNGYAQWRIYASDDVTFVIVDKKAISIHKGERSRYEISDDPLIAATLFSALEQAQAVVSTVVPNEEPMTDEEQESYFEGDYNISAGLDEALADTHVEPLSADDAELIHDVTAEEALDEDQRQEDGPEPIITVSQKFIEAVSEAPQRFEDKNVNRVEAEVARVKEEYPELKEELKELGKLKQAATKWAAPVSGKGMISETWAGSRLKSLQGRILTIMDASIGDKEQRAAVKTLINKEFRRELSSLGEPAMKKEE